MPSKRSLATIFSSLVELTRSLHDGTEIGTEDWITRTDARQGFRCTRSPRHRPRATTAARSPFDVLKSDPHFPVPELFQARPLRMRLPPTRSCSGARWPLQFLPHPHRGRAGPRAEPPPPPRWGCAPGPPMRRAAHSVSRTRPRSAPKSPSVRPRPCLSCFLFLVEEACTQQGRARLSAHPDFCARTFVCCYAPCGGRLSL
jgi:hypothetical protein